MFEQSAHLTGANRLWSARVIYKITRESTVIYKAPSIVHLLFERRNDDDDGVRSRQERDRPRSLLFFLIFFHLRHVCAPMTPNPGLCFYDATKIAVCPVLPLAYQRPIRFKIRSGGCARYCSPSFHRHSHLLPSHRTPVALL